MRRLISHLNLHELKNAYGMSEFLPLCSDVAFVPISDVWNFFADSGNEVRLSYRRYLISDNVFVPEALYRSKRRLRTRSSSASRRSGRSSRTSRRSSSTPRETSSPSARPERSASRGICCRRGTFSSTWLQLNLRFVCLLLKSCRPTVKRYWNDPEQTKAAMKTHPGDPDTLWMHTGDTGIMDEEGYLRGW